MARTCTTAGIESTYPRFAVCHTGFQFHEETGRLDGRACAEKHYADTSDVAFPVASRSSNARLCRPRLLSSRIRRMDDRRVALTFVD